MSVKKHHLYAGGTHPVTKHQCYWHDQTTTRLGAGDSAPAASVPYDAAQFGHDYECISKSVVDRKTGVIAHGVRGLVTSCISDRARSADELSETMRRGPEGLGRDRYVSIQVGPADVVVHKSRCVLSPPMSRGTRSEIMGFTDASRRRLKLAVRNTEGLVYLVTLTYPGEYPTDGGEVKRHWSCMRKWLVRRKLGGFWLLEFQRRGAPHYHVFLNRPVDKHALSAAWYRIVASEDERHLRAGTKCEYLRKPHAASAYAAKYAGKKGYQKAVPDEYIGVGRFWGFFGKVRPAWKWEYAGREGLGFYRVLRVIRGYLKSKGIRRRDDGYSTCGITVWGGAGIYNKYHEPPF